MKRIPLSILLSLCLLAATFGESFEVNLKSKPAVELSLDRKYDILEIGPQKTGKKDLALFMFNPADGQSSAVLAWGRDMFLKTEESIKEGYEGTDIEKVPTKIAGVDAEWWRYKDSRHLYSTCYVNLPDGKGKVRPFAFDLVANSEERLKALEESFENIIIKK